MRYAHAYSNFPSFDQPKTFAPSPVWKGSVAGAVKFAPLDETPALSRKKAAKIFNHMLRLERQTARTRVDAFAKRHTQGCLGHMGILVGRAMLFGFLNHRTGQLDPSHQAIALEAGVCVASVKRALLRLRAAGILNWIRRCTGTMQDDRFVLEQDTNAYAILPPTQWRGYRPPPEPSPPDPDTWGASPPAADASVQAAEALRNGDQRRALAMWEQTRSEPAAGLFAAMASATRRRLS